MTSRIWQVGWASLLVWLAGCHRDSPPDEFFPLASGHHWTYRITTRGADGDSTGESLGLESLDVAAMPGESPGISGHRRSDDGVEYWLRADSGGVRRVASQSIGDREPRQDAPQRPVLKAPYSVGTAWQASTTAYLLVRKFDFPREVHHTYPPVPMTYRIESTAETIETPAGRWSGCLRVRGSAAMRVYADPVVGWRDVPLTTLEWYCAGVGLVRLERTEPAPSSFMTGGSQMWELVDFR